VVNDGTRGGEGIGKGGWEFGTGGEAAARAERKAATATVRSDRKRARRLAQTAPSVAAPPAYGPSDLDRTVEMSLNLKYSNWTRPPHGAARWNGAELPFRRCP
jgi:hypothetical protein